ncbi:DUF3488 and transglutaminase-like domain-containing protein [Actinomycetes bacterium KLBMP 9797]
MRNRHLGFVAAAATLLAAAPLATIFERWTWLIQSIVAVALIAGAATLTRALRAPVWAQLLSMLATLLIVLTVMFPSGDELLLLIPTPDTISHFGALIGFAMDDMQAYGVPVPDRPGLQFLTVLGVSGVAILVDLLTVSLRRPALAGLPMLAIYSVPVAIYTTSVNPVPFVIGAVGFLWLLAADNVDRVRRFGRRFTGDGRDVDVWEPSPLAAAGRRLAVVGVALAVLLPLAVPGMTTGLLANFGTGAGAGVGPGRGGSPGQVNLFSKLSGELNQTEVRELVKVTTNDPNPFYLRFGVAEQLGQDGFSPSGLRGAAVRNGLPDPRDTADRGVRFREYEATVEITENFDMPMLPVYTAPIRTQDVEGNWQYDTNRQVLFSNRLRSKEKTYGFTYVRPEYAQTVLRRAEIDETDPARQFVNVPPQPEVEKLVADVTRGKANQYDEVLAIHQYFSWENGFRYSLATKLGTSGSQIVDFLKNKVGFCQQYAAAMAWMVRAAGYPARVAFGFTGGGSRDDNTTTLTNRNLHAWTEVYFGDEIGWVPFDATPATSVQGSSRSAWAPDPDAVETPNPTPSTSTAPVPGSSSGPLGPDNSTNDEADLGAGLGDTTPTQPRWPWYTLAAVLLALALLAVPALRRRLLRRSRSRLTAAPAALVPAGPPGAPQVVIDVSAAGPAREDAHAAWAELLDTMIDYRVPVDPTETPRATADRLATGSVVDGPAAAAARLLGQAEERARYAREPLQAGGLGEALRAVRQALRAQAGRRTRLAAAVLPPSVLLRWRLAIVDTSIGLMSAGGRIRERLLRFSPRRLLARSRP